MEEVKIGHLCRSDVSRANAYLVDSSGPAGRRERHMRKDGPVGGVPTMSIGTCRAENARLPKCWTFQSQMIDWRESG